MTHNSSDLVFYSLPKHHVLNSVCRGVVCLFVFIETYAGKFVLFHLESIFFPEKSFSLFQVSLT